jgi:hypothetical protein
LVSERSSGLLRLEELAFAAALFDQPLWWSTSAWAFVEPVVVLVAARDDVRFVEEQWSATPIAA